MSGSKEGKEELGRVRSASVSELGQFETSKIGNSDAQKIKVGEEEGRI